MSRYLVVAADASRARFFTLEDQKKSKFKSGPRLDEHSQLENPEFEQRDSDVFSETKTGSNRAPGGGAHTYDDHRDRHQAEFARRFARTLAIETKKIADSVQPDRLVLAASAKMLGLIRQEDGALERMKADKSELARDVTKMAPQQIQSVLAGEGLLPECAPPEQVR